MTPGRKVSYILLFMLLVSSFNPMISLPVAQSEEPSATARAVGGLSSYSNQVAVRTEARWNLLPLFGRLVLLVAGVVAVIFAWKKGLLGLPKGT